jgi:hypothetical protein
MDRFGGMAPAIGGALLGPVGALGGLALQSRRYTGIRDMFDGGGAGKAGPTFQGGTYSGLLNALGVRPRGFRDRQAGILERQQAAPTTMAGAMGGGSAAPAAVPAAAPVTAQTPSGPIYSFPYRGSGATPATAYQPFTPLSYGPPTRPFVGARTPAVDDIYAPPPMSLSDYEFLGRLPSVPSLRTPEMPYSLPPSLRDIAVGDPMTNQEYADLQMAYARQRGLGQPTITPRPRPRMTLNEQLSIGAGPFYYGMTGGA